MAIVELNKVTIYGAADRREDALDALQELGVMHLIDLKNDGARLPALGLVSIDSREAIAYLRACPNQRRPSKRWQDYSSQSIIARTLCNKREQEALSDERDHVAKAIEDMTPWGEFRTPPAEELGQAQLWFYVVPRRNIREIATLDVPYQIASEDNTSLYVVAVSGEAPQFAGGNLLELDSRPLSELKERAVELDELLEDLYWDRVELTRWTQLLQTNLDEADDRAARQWAERLSISDADLFAVQGWAPRQACEDIELVALRHGLAITITEPTANEHPPTLLENPERIAGAEGAVTFYITPAYSAWDPTSVVFVSFSLFFGMIVADAGYGLLLAAALLFFWRRLGKTANGFKMRYLLLAIIVVTTVFGVMAGSYFGMTPKPGSFLGRLQILDFANRGQMMALSILIGVTHLSLANLISAWHARHSLRALASIGWVLMMFGALIMATELVKTSLSVTVAPLGKWVIILGGLLVLAFSSDRPLHWTNFRDWIGRLFDGVGALTGITKLFGDVLSYLRLFALGLASAQLAATFNQLAADMSHTRGLGLLLAAVILIAGHGINIVLGLMGGVVHGLRLNCIEFFNWSLNEEGSTFRPYRKKVTT